ncbi:MAG: 2-C-methyl-D-erythritol 2,4-cyclodiphosphate synthase [Acidobacteriota bacterium]
MDVRSGVGYDIHRLVQNRALVLGGVAIPYSLGLDGHSDADCLLHALCDALLGAVGEDDIGSHFPDDDPANAGVSSERFVIRALELVRGAGYAVSNVDCILFAEKPRLGETKAAIRENLARILALPRDRIAVKAKTGERLGPIGRGEAIAALVSVLVTRE